MPQRCELTDQVEHFDRFAQRVLYSRPYYLASYRQVVRNGADPPGAQERIAVEEGVAVRGLKGRSVQWYPSTVRIR